MAKRGGFPGGMPGNMNNIMKQAQKMQKQMEEATKELQEKEVTSSAGGGVVEVTVSGNREVTKVKIDPEAVDPDDVEMLEDRSWQQPTRRFARSRRFLHSPCQRLQADLAEWEAASRFKPLRSSHGLLQQSN